MDNNTNRCFLTIKQKVPFNYPKMDTFFVLQGVRKIYYILSGRILDVYVYTFEMSLVSVVLLRSYLLQPTSSYF